MAVKKSTKKKSTSTKSSSSSFKKGGVYLLVASKNYQDHNLKNIKHFVNDKKKSTVYVTLKEDPQKFIAKMQAKKINTDKVFIISSCKAKTKQPNVAHIPQSCLTSLSIAITTAINSGNFDVLIIDSLTTMLIYNKLGPTQRFLHFLLNKTKGTNISTIILSMAGDKKTKEILPSITEICDKQIKLN